MHRDHRFNPKAVPPFANQGGDNYMHLPVSSSFPDDLLPIYGVQFQPSEVCPRNFVIVDQTDHHSQIMFNPAIGYKFSAPNFNAPSSFIHESFMGKEDALDIKKELSSWKEDSHDIDALLSLDEEDDGDDESDEDEVSTARTYGSSSPGSCSNYDHHYNSRSNVCSSGSSSNSSEKKQLKMKRMVKALKGIVPGGEQMNTVTIIDEAVKYLKTLKVEAQKLGVGKLKDYYE
ncbi:unnamed protein product [Linum tenue]|uniref:BHLH domain-containing protein n=1 Tax=Linum tenue TaxID=586396 RepID=A0AAV0N0D5_9ROSI|nr:unnamed protein product [Linum tenue]